jgi:hypothetical protein
MPLISALANDLQKLSLAVQERLPEVAVTLTVSAKALAERRIKEGALHETYSTIPLPGFYFKGKELNGSGTAFLESLEPKKRGAGKKKKVEEITEADLADGETTWGDFRKAQGLQNSYVDLSYSNKMFAAMGPQAPEVNGAVIIVPLGANNKEAQNKMNWNRDRYGNFIEKSLSNEDKGFLVEVVKEGVNDIIQQSNIIK